MRRLSIPLLSSLMAACTAIADRTPTARLDPKGFCSSLISAVATADRERARQLLLSSASGAVAETAVNVSRTAGSLISAVEVVAGGRPIRLSASILTFQKDGLAVVIERWRTKLGDDVHIVCSLGRTTAGRDVILVLAHPRAETLADEVVAFFHLLRSTPQGRSI